MPLTLVLDVGAVLQMVVLIIEKHDETLLDVKIRPADPRRGLRVLWDTVRDAVRNLKVRIVEPRGAYEPSQNGK